jgi:hypothetical protein
LNLCYRILQGYNEVTLQYISTYNYVNIVGESWNLKIVGLGLWCLTLLSTIFYRKLSNIYIWLYLFLKRIDISRFFQFNIDSSVHLTLNTNYQSIITRPKISRARHIMLWVCRWHCGSCHLPTVYFHRV